MRLGQTKVESAVEVAVSTGIGFSVAFTANLIILPIFGFTPSLSQNFWLTIFFTIVSLVRSYFVRRLFNWWHASRLHRELFK